MYLLKFCISFLTNWYYKGKLYNFYILLIFISKNLNLSSFIMIRVGKIYHNLTNKTGIFF
jgi:hypothetical protein